MQASTHSIQVRKNSSNRRKKKNFGIASIKRVEILKKKINMRTLERFTVESFMLFEMENTYSTQMSLDLKMGWFF